MSSLLDLPNEILIQIVSLLDETNNDINSLIRCNRRLYTLFNTHLYLQNISHHESRALLWASEHGRESTLLRLLELGADVNAKTTPEYRYDFGDGVRNTALNGLYLSCLHGHPNIARILLEAGINDSDYACARESMPLYYALRRGHDDVALVLLEHFTDIHLPLSWTKSYSTPLHLASYLGLSSLVRLLLSKSADVLKEDTHRLTALHYALLGSQDVCKECSNESFFVMRKEVRFQSKGEGYAADVETVRLLLEAGAELERKMEKGSWRHKHSARQLARGHPDGEMRRLCGVDGGWLGRIVGWK